jgi:hypothetical protein
MSSRERRGCGLKFIGPAVFVILETYVDDFPRIL